MKTRLVPLLSALLLLAAPFGAAEERTRFSSFDKISVSPLGRDSRLVDAGVLVADGRKRIVLNLVGEISGKVGERGTIGAVLVPLIPELGEAIRNRRGFPPAREVSVAVTSGQSGFFAAEQVETAVGFPRYRVFLWNETDSTATVSVYAYLTD